MTRYGPCRDNAIEDLVQDARHAGDAAMTTPEPTPRDEGLVVNGLSDDAYFALREKLSRAADEHLTRIFGDGDRGDVAEETIEAVLAALTVSDIAAHAAPDAATVERVAEAIHGAYTALGRRQGRAGIPPVPWEELDDATRENNRFIATLALGALAALPAPPSLEGLLDGERYTVRLLTRTSWKAPEGHWLAVVNDREQGRMLAGKDFEGVGPTIEQAVRNAITAAKEEK